MFVRKSTHTAIVAELARTKGNLDRAYESRDSWRREAESRPVKPSKTEKRLTRAFENLSHQLDQAIAMEDHAEAIKVIGTIAAYKESLSVA